MSELKSQIEDARWCYRLDPQSRNRGNTMKREPTDLPVSDLLDGYDLQRQQDTDQYPAYQH